MSNPAPILRLIGTVHGAPEARHVAPVDAKPAEYDDAGNFLKAARAALPGYTVHDVTVLTAGGGFAQLVIRDEAVADAGSGFSLPSDGDTIDYPVRAFDQWKGNPGRRFRVTAYSFAGKVWASEQSSGRRVAAVS